MFTAIKEADAVNDSIRKALRSALAAQKESYGDVRSSSTLCTDHIDAAVKNLEAAAQWMAQFWKEERTDERRADSQPKRKTVEKFVCHACENEIEPGDVAVCGGCDKATCPEFMADEGICVECEADGE
jgi:hypothetical protein